MKLNKRKCKNCKEVFQKTTPLQYACSPKCAIELAKQKVAKEKAKDDKAEKKRLKESLLTHKDYIQMAQKVFNTYVRMRDKDKPCISCGTMENVKYDAGHYIPTTYQYLRFNEFNVNKQCSNNCNKHKSGNVVEYRIGLINRYGIEVVEKLEADRHLLLDITIPELKELITKYKQKIKQLK